MAYLYFPDTCEEILAAENSDQTDHDSINWEYQLPPPPTDFRDTNSPSCTEFGTITITPDVFENVDSYRPTQEEKSLSKKSEQIDRSINLKFQVNGFGVENENNYEYNHHIYRSGSEKKLSQTKVEVMNELTNILNENRKQKEKSLSVNNLYINDSIAEEKRSALNYSRSFSTEPVFSLMNGNAEQRYANGLSNNNKKLSISNEIVRDNEITYRNYKNLEKSSSMESIQVSKLDNGVQLIEKSEEIFRKPVAPVQKKLKVARRSASSLGVNTSIQKKRNATGNGQDSWSEDPNLSVLREQFLEFLREKKLMMNAKDLNMKSLDVICNILPEVVKNSNSAEDRVVEEKNEINSHEHAQTQSGLEREDKVKVVDVKVKPPFETPQDESKPTDFLRHEEKVIKEGNKVENPSKITQQQQQQKKQELTKRYSYQGPPSINFGTWGERPKTTRIIIKDEDYVTQENVTEKKSEMIQSAAPKSADTDQKPKEVKKTQIVIKKPGVLSHYEMFSALPRKKEISSLKMMFMEEDEKRRRNLIESKDSSRVPVVCGMELKKEFKEVETPGKTQISPPPTAPQEELNKPRHAVSVYINGCREEEGKDKAVCLKSTPSFMIPKRNPTLMPVVKGFRSLEDSIPKNRVNVVNSAANNQININIAGCSKEGPGDHNQKWCPQPFKLQTIGSVPPPPPPPPNINSIKLKPVSCEYARSKTVSQDPRSQLLDEIRNFGGLKKLNKSTAH